MDVDILKWLHYVDNGLFTPPPPRKNPLNEMEDTQIHAKGENVGSRVQE